MIKFGILLPAYGKIFAGTLRPRGSPRGPPTYEVSAAPDDRGACDRAARALRGAFGPLAAFRCRVDEREVALCRKLKTPIKN